MAITAAQRQANLQQAYDNYTRLLVMVTEIINTPGGNKQSQIDALVNAAAAANLVVPRPTVGIDGESYDWTGYQQMIISNLKGLQEAIQFAGGPWIGSMRGVV